MGRRYTMKHHRAIKEALEKTGGDEDAALKLLLQQGYPDNLNSVKRGKKPKIAKTLDGREIECDEGFVIA
jgi:hypothetical protein